jgi:hypothetical protein
MVAGGMAGQWRIACWHAIAGMAAALPLSAPADAVADHAVAPLTVAARRAGLRVLTGEHLTLVTDRPARDGDGVAELPQVFDEAFVAWCHHYGTKPQDHRDWRAFGCLVVNRDRFRAAGLLPDSVPDFSNGFCDRNRFWMIDQTNAAYRRHLLLHEGVHAFTISRRNLDTPAWYTEGIAELLATHRLEVAADGGPQFVATPMPQAATDVEQLGRIEAIRRLRAAGEMPGLNAVVAAEGSAHGDMTLYASSWAAAAMLSLHPRYAAAFAATEREGLGRDFTSRLTRSPGWDAATVARDFDAFTDDVDYGYDFSRSAIDWGDGIPPAGRRVGPQVVEVDAARGWQNSGLRLTRGQRYTVRAQGRAKVGQASACHQDASACQLETEPDGISIDWYRGRPLGRLLAAQWAAFPVGPDAAPGGRPRFLIVAEGAAGDFIAPVDGPLFFKLNESPGDLADNAGAFQVDVSVGDAAPSP